MESTWGLAIFMWAALIIGLVALLIHESRKTEEQRAYEREQARQRYEQERLSHKIVEVIPLGVVGRKNKRGGAKGALMGGFFGGVPGVAVGAALPSGPSVPVYRFAVKYGDGKVVIRECMQGSSEYKALMKRVEQ